jgi:hypothetical protein
LASQTTADVQTNPVPSTLQVVRSALRRAGWPDPQARGVPAILRQSSSLYKMHSRPSQTPVNGRGDPDRPAVLRYPRLDSLDRFYRLASDSIVAHDGIVDNVVGDEVIGLFFGGITGPRHAAAAAAAAIDLAERAARASTTPAVAIPVGTAVHTVRHSLARPGLAPPSTTSPHSVMSSTSRHDSHRLRLQAR